MFNNQSFTEEVKSKSGQPIDLCFQCQKCASGCSMVRYTDFAPNQILRLVQMGMEDNVLNSSMIWLCSSCEICGARCPNGIKMSEVMDTLKQIAIGKNVIKVKRVKLFHEVFLGTVKSNGRIHEATMMARYKLKSGDLFSDIDLGLKLFLRRKLPLLGHKIKNKERLKRIFERSVHK